MLIVLAITGVAQWIMNICNNYITYHVVQISERCHRPIQIVPLKYLDGHAAGDIKPCDRRCGPVCRWSSDGIYRAFTGVMTIVGTLVFMLQINVWITLVVILVTPLSFFVAGFIAKKVLRHVSNAVKGKRSPDGFDRRDDRQSESGTGIWCEKRSLEQFDEINGRLEKYSLRPPSFHLLPTRPHVLSTIWCMRVGIVGAFLPFTECCLWDDSPASKLYKPVYQAV